VLSRGRTLLLVLWVTDLLRVVVQAEAAGKSDVWQQLQQLCMRSWPGRGPGVREQAQGKRQNRRDRLVQKPACFPVGCWGQTADTLAAVCA
jgi:hypothetical protein